MCSGCALASARMPRNFRSDCFGSYDSRPEEVSYLKHPFIPTSNALIMSLLLPCDNVPRFMARKRPLLPFEVAAGDWDCVTVSRSKVCQGIFGGFGPGDSGFRPHGRRFSKKFQTQFFTWLHLRRGVRCQISMIFLHSGPLDVLVYFRDPRMIPLFEHHMATHSVRDIHRLEMVFKS